jgi:hypothetical protein
LALFFLDFAFFFDFFFDFLVFGCFGWETTLPLCPRAPWVPMIGAGGAVLSSP